MKYINAVELFGWSITGIGIFFLLFKGVTYPHFLIVFIGLLAIILNFIQKSKKDKKYNSN